MLRAHYVHGMYVDTYVNGSIGQIFGDKMLCPQSSTNFKHVPQNQDNFELAYNFARM